MLQCHHPSSRAAAATTTPCCSQIRRVLGGASGCFRTVIFSPTRSVSSSSATPNNSSSDSTSAIPTFHPAPFTNPKFLSLQSRTVGQYIQLKHDIVRRQNKLLERLEKEHQAEATAPSGGGAAQTSKRQRTTAPSAASSGTALPVPLAKEVEVLERKLLQLENEQGFGLDDAIVWSHFHLLVCASAYVAAMQWWELQVVAKGRTAPFPSFVRSDWMRVMQQGVLPVLPHPSSHVRLHYVSPFSKLWDTQEHRSLLAMRTAAASAIPLLASSGGLESGLKTLMDHLKVRHNAYPPSPQHYTTVMDDTAITSTAQLPVDDVLNVKELSTALLQSKPSSAGGVLHADYAHHSMVTYVLPLLRVADTMGLLFDDVSPLHHDQDTEVDQEGDEEEERPTAATTIGKRATIASSYCPTVGHELADDQHQAVQRVLHLFVSSEPSDGNCEPVVSALRTLQDVLDFYAALVQCACECPEPSVLLVIQSAILAGFFCVEEDGGSSSSSSSSLPAMRVAEEAWLQGVMAQEETGEALSSAMEEGRRQLHAFLQDTIQHLYVARHTLHLERLLMSRSLHMMGCWAAMRSIAGSSCANLPLQQQESLCRAMQCLHGEWRRTTTSRLSAAADGNSSSSSVVERGAGLLSLCGFALHQPPSRVPLPPGVSPAIPSESALTAHRLWEEMDACFRCFLAHQLQQQKDQWCSSSWLVALTSPSYTSSHPSLVEKLLLQAPVNQQSSGESTAVDGDSHVPSWLSPVAAELVMVNSKLHELLQYLTSSTVGSKEEVEVEQRLSAIRRDSDGDSHQQLQCFSERLGTQSIHSMVEWELTLEQLLLALSVDLHQLIRDVPPLAAEQSAAAGGDNDLMDGTDEADSRRGDHEDEGPSLHINEDELPPDSHLAAAMDEGEAAMMVHDEEDAAVPHGTTPVVEQQPPQHEDSSESPFVTLHYLSKLSSTDPSALTAEQVAHHLHTCICLLLEHLPNSHSGEEEAATPSPAALASIALLEATAHLLTGSKEVERAAVSTLQKVVVHHLLPLQDAANDGLVSDGNAAAVVALAAARVGLWGEVEQVLNRLFGVEKEVGEVRCTAVQLDPFLLASLLEAAKAAAEPGVCLLLQRHRELVFF